MNPCSLSIVIPFLNEEHNLERALSSLVRQTFPFDRLKVLLVDGGSTDRSLPVINSYRSLLPIAVLDNFDHREAEWGKGIGIGAATTDLVQCMDADQWLTDDEMLLRLACPLRQDASLAGSISRFVYAPELSPWARFLSLDPLQRDPLYQKLTPDLETFVSERHEKYLICEFPTPRIPPIGGTTMYRRSDIDLQRWSGAFNDVDHAAYLVERGLRRFAYIDDIGWGHHHCKGLAHLVRKRRRNLDGQSNSYLRLQVHRDYVWLDTSDRREVLSLIRWIIGTNLVVPRLVEGIRDTATSRHWEAMLRPVVALVLTDTLIWGLLASADGRALIRHAIAGRSFRSRIPSEPWHLRS